MSDRVYLNMSFVGQRITGQQRFATEISRRLGGRSVVVPVFVPSWVRWSPLRWLWVQLILPVRTWRGTLVSLTTRAPVVHPRHIVAIHDLFPLTNPEWFSARFASVQAFVLKAHLRSAKTIVAVSEPVAEQVRALAKRAPEVIVIPNAPSEIFTADGPDTSGVLERLDLTSGSYFLVVGSRDPRKNLSRVVSAYGTLSAEERARTPLVVAGTESSIFERENISWPDGTVHIGYVTDDELVDLYRNARATVFASLAEGFGLPVVEAAACGSPLILSDIPVFRWLCGEAATYVDPHDTASVAAALRSSLRGRSRENEAGLRVVSQRFSWDRSAGRLLETITGSLRSERPIG
ncbi:glycosyltransferase family 4 protein [Antiquaquibacter oligotrophicus]|uniref:glycosyltransferase family 4 protein n=1 Tax=Antiquaquibacter oligotrophicus TaxID=2880260 RepID=UPI002AC91C4E|nr:glycosyltransferase family 1 protein [Antiquaquibacter oligotrophicus]UDF14031.1 glycosyltransferase family 4 protein [Antiquaquibacter oligotrophicus]